MKVSQLIKGQEVVTVRIDQTLGDVAERIARSHVSGLPVVDEWGVLAGLVTASRIVEVLGGETVAHAAPKGGHGHAAAARDWRTIPVREVMATDLCTVDEDDEVQHAAHGMTSRHVHRAVVLGKDRNVRGVLSALDVVKLVADGRSTLS